VRAFLTPAWLLRHAVLLLAVAVCAALGWWQFDRARSGNMLSYAYAVEWPVFAIFAIGVWVREIRLTARGEDPAVARRADPAAPSDPLLTTVPVRTREAPQPDQDGDLGAYNDYLAWLAEDPTRRPADYR
jgi:DNA-binding transcriptional regulator of glucitol operon